MAGHTAHADVDAKAQLRRHEDGLAAVLRALDDPAMTISDIAILGYLGLAHRIEIDRLKQPNAPTAA